MKKKVIIALVVFSSIFLLGGIYITVTIETSTSKLDALITLHKVEILRENLLLQIKRVQSDINLINTRYARSIDAVVANVKDMGDAKRRCFECHHSDAVLKRLFVLRGNIEKYKDAINRVLTIRANISRLKLEEDRAFEIGEGLITEVKNMIIIAGSKLDERTKSSLMEIAYTKVILYILVGIVPILAAVFGYTFIKGFTEPVNVLLNATRRLKGGDLDYRIAGLKDEFGEVAASFNDMLSSLRQHIDKKERAEQMIMLGELAAGLAHEIKNPLTGIKASIEVLTEGVNIPEEDRDVIIKAVNEIKRIELLIKSLLNFAKPSRPQLMLTDINDTLDKTIAFSLKHPTVSSNTSATINVLKDFDRKLPETMADPMQLQQVFLNLLLNAIEAMPEGGTLSVRTSYDTGKNTIRIEFSNTGKKIDEKIIDKIFQPFFTTKTKGTGLGLAITKQLIEQHGGKVWVENKQGGGVIFYVGLPARKEEE